MIKIGQPLSRDLFKEAEDLAQALEKNKKNSSKAIDSFINHLQYERENNPQFRLENALQIFRKLTPGAKKEETNSLKNALTATINEEIIEEFSQLQSDKEKFDQEISIFIQNGPQTSEENGKLLTERLNLRAKQLEERVQKLFQSLEDPNVSKLLKPETLKKGYLTLTFSSFIQEAVSSIEKRIQEEQKNDLFKKTEKLFQELIETLSEPIGVIPDPEKKVKDLLDIIGKSKNPEEVPKEVKIKLYQALQPLLELSKEKKTIPYTSGVQKIIEQVTFSLNEAKLPENYKNEFLEVLRTFNTSVTTDEILSLQTEIENLSQQNKIPPDTKKTILEKLDQLTQWSRSIINFSIFSDTQTYTLKTKLRDSYRNHFLGAVARFVYSLPQREELEKGFTLDLTSPSAPVRDLEILSCHPSELRLKSSEIRILPRALSIPAGAPAEIGFNRDDYVSLFPVKANQKDEKDGRAPTYEELGKILFQTRYFKKEGIPDLALCSFSADENNTTAPRYFLYDPNLRRFRKENECKSETPQKNPLLLTNENITQKLEILQELQLTKGDFCVRSTQEEGLYLFLNPDRIGHFQTMLSTFVKRMETEHSDLKRLKLEAELAAQLQGAIKFGVDSEDTSVKNIDKAKKSSFSFLDGITAVFGMIATSVIAYSAFTSIATSKEGMALNKEAFEQQKGKGLDPASFFETGESYLKNRAPNFVKEGAPYKVVKNILSYIMGPTNKHVLIQGEAGTGKTTLLGGLIQEIEEIKAIMEKDPKQFPLESFGDFLKAEVLVLNTNKISDAVGPHIGGVNRTIAQLERFLFPKLKDKIEFLENWIKDPIENHKFKASKETIDAALHLSKDHPQGSTMGAKELFLELEKAFPEGRAVSFTEKDVLEHIANKQKTKVKRLTKILTELRTQKVLEWEVVNKIILGDEVHQLVGVGVGEGQPISLLDHFKGMMTRTKSSVVLIFATTKDEAELLLSRRDPITKEYKLDPAMKGRFRIEELPMPDLPTQVKQLKAAVQTEMRQMIKFSISEKGIEAALKLGNQHPRGAVEGAKEIVSTLVGKHRMGHISPIYKDVDFKIDQEGNPSFTEEDVIRYEANRRGTTFETVQAELDPKMGRFSLLEIDSDQTVISTQNNKPASVSTEPLPPQAETEKAETSSSITTEKTEGSTQSNLKESPEEVSTAVNDLSAKLSFKGSIFNGFKGFAGAAVPFVALDTFEGTGVISSTERKVADVGFMGTMLYFNPYAATELAFLYPGMMLGEKGGRELAHLAGAEEQSLTSKISGTLGTLIGGSLTGAGLAKWLGGAENLHATVKFAQDRGMQWIGQVGYSLELGLRSFVRHPIEATRTVIQAAPRIGKGVVQIGAKLVDIGKKNPKAAAAAAVGLLVLGGFRVYDYFHNDQQNSVTRTVNNSLAEQILESNQLGWGEKTLWKGAQLFMPKTANAKLAAQASAEERQKVEKIHQDFEKTAPSTAPTLSKELEKVIDDMN